jgi:CheY-like chemotaxis protein
VTQIKTVQQMSRTTILVIEDEPLIRMAIADDLRDAGFHTLEAANADDALDILSTEASIGAIFTDIDLHGKLDGLSVAWIVRDRWPPIAIIITSGKGG